MATSTARILTPCVGDGLSARTAFRPQLLDDYLGQIKSFKDITQQDGGPDRANYQPNLFSVEITADNTVLDTIEADKRYFVLWRDKPDGKQLSTGKQSELKDLLVKQGMKKKDADDLIVGTSAVDVSSINTIVHNKLKKPDIIKKS